MRTERADLAVGIAATAVLAVWRRPPARPADCARDRGDVYGGPLGFGVLTGLFGLLTLTGHAAFHGLLGGTRCLPCPDS